MQLQVSQSEKETKYVCDALRSSGPHACYNARSNAHMTDARSSVESISQQHQTPPTNIDRSWNRGKYMWRERGIPRSQQPLANASLSFVHTARRYGPLWASASFIVTTESRSGSTWGASSTEPRLVPKVSNSFGYFPYVHSEPWWAKLYT